MCLAELSQMFRSKTIYRGGCPVLKKWSFLGTKGEAYRDGQLPGHTARERQTESPIDLLQKAADAKPELTFEGHAHCKSFFLRVVGLSKYNFQKSC